MVFHFIFVYVIKYYYSPEFRQGNKKLKKIFHILTQLAIPTVYKDWDDVDGLGVMKSYLKVSIENKLSV
jgi:hypothetical protein